MKHVLMHLDAITRLCLIVIRITVCILEYIISLGAHFPVRLVRWTTYGTGGGPRFLVKERRAPAQNSKQVGRLGRPYKLI